MTSVSYFRHLSAPVEENKLMVSSSLLLSFDCRWQMTGRAI